MLRERHQNDNNYYRDPDPAHIYVRAVDANSRAADRDVHVNHYSGLDTPNDNTSSVHRYCVRF